MKLSKFNEDIFTYTVDTVWGLMEVVVTTGAIVQSSSQIITTNKPTPSFFYRPDALAVAQPTMPKH